MDIVEMIKKCRDDDELKELVDEVIEVYTNMAKYENDDMDYIGTCLDINPINYHIDDPNFEIDRYYDCVNFWKGYIPLGTKIVYGRFYIPKYRTSSHKGCYYYVDDDNYIFDFFKMIKEEKDIDNVHDIIFLVFRFIEKKFVRYFNPKDRNVINKLIHKTDELYFRPVKEHSIKDFYGNGSAMCSEIALIAENLMSVLGYEIMYMEDKEHAYNIFVDHVDEKDVDIYVLDFANWVECYDVNFNLIAKSPYIEKIDGGDNELIDQMVNHGKRIELDDYYLYSINDSIYEVRDGQKRSFGTDFALEEEKSILSKAKVRL